MAFLARIIVVTLGGILFLSGASSAVSNLGHARRSVDATAEVTGHRRTCTAEFKLVGEGKQKVAMECDEALAIERRLGRSKFRVSEDRFVLVRYRLPDGTMHAGQIATYRLSKGDASTVGATFAVKVDPAKPGDVRPALGWSDVEIWLSLIGLGLAALAIAFIDHLFRFVGFLHRGRKADAATGTDASKIDAVQAAGRLPAPAPHGTQAPPLLRAGRGQHSPRAFGTRA